VAAQTTAFDAALLASLCSQHGSGTPSRPDPEHCPDMPCCMLSVRHALDGGPAILVAVPGWQPRLSSISWSAWPFITSVRNPRISQSPRQARAPPV
jgi:hypothetical protein